MFGDQDNKAPTQVKSLLEALFRSDGDFQIETASSGVSDVRLRDDYSEIEADLEQLLVSVAAVFVVLVTVVVLFLLGQSLRTSKLETKNRLEIVYAAGAGGGPSRDVGFYDSDLEESW